MGVLIHLPARVPGGLAPPIDAEPCPVVRLWDWVDRAREAQRVGRSTNLRRAHFDRLVTRALDRVAERRPGETLAPQPPRGTDSYED